MTNEEELILGIVENMRECEDWEIEQLNWSDDWDAEIMPIDEIALYLIEKRITEESEYFKDRLPDAYLEQLKAKIISLMQIIIKQARNSTWDQYDKDLPARLDKILGDHADMFIHDAHRRFQIRSVLEAKEVIACIDLLNRRYGYGTLYNVRIKLKANHLHGSVRAKGYPKISEFKGELKVFCDPRITIRDKQRKEKIINKIIDIVTS